MNLAAKAVTTSRNPEPSTSPQHVIVTIFSVQNGHAKWTQRPFGVSKMDTRNGHHAKRWKQYIRTLIDHYVSSFPFIPCGQSSNLIDYILLIESIQSLLLSTS